MNRKFKIFLTVALVTLFFSIFANPAQAAILDAVSDDPCDLCAFGQLLNSIKFFAFSILGSITVIMIIIGGVMYMMSSGIPAQMQRAKSIITNGITGLVISLLAWVIVSAVISALFGQLITSQLWSFTCPTDISCEGAQPSSGPGSEDPSTWDEDGDGDLEGTWINNCNMAPAAPNLRSCMSCLSGEVPDGQTWTVTSVQDESRPECKASNAGNPSGCKTNQCTCKGKHCPYTNDCLVPSGSNCPICEDAKRCSTGRVCNHKYGSCHYGGESTQPPCDMSYAFDLVPGSAETALRSALQETCSNECGSMYIYRHGSGSSDHVHSSVPNPCGCQ